MRGPSAQGARRLARAGVLVKGTVSAAGKGNDVMARLSCALPAGR